MITEVNRHTGECRIYNDEQFRDRLRSLPVPKESLSQIEKRVLSGNTFELKHQWFRFTQPTDYEHLERNSNLDKRR